MRWLRLKCGRCRVGAICDRCGMQVFVLNHEQSLLLGAEPLSPLLKCTLGTLIIMALHEGSIIILPVTKGALG